MRTIILGKKIENVYGVNHNQKPAGVENGDVKTVYTDRPTLKMTPHIKEWAEICSYDGEPRYNTDRGYVFSIGGSYQINISEDETIAVGKEIFRADLNEVHLQTNKVIEEVDINKGESEEILAEQIRAFNSMMISSNEKLKSYCDVHKLSYEDTDAIELFGIVFPDENYEIVDGAMKVKERKCPELYMTSSKDAWGSLIDGLKHVSVHNNVNITNI